MSHEPNDPPIFNAPYAAVPPSGTDGKATASLVLGICSAVLWLCPLVGVVLAIIGLTLGVQSNRRRQSGSARAGVILSIIGIVLSVINGGIGAYLGATGQNQFLNQFVRPPATQPQAPSAPPPASDSSDE